MKKSSIMAGVLALILFVSIQMGTPGSALAQGHRGGHDRPGFLNGLTPEQREAVHDRMAEMRDQGGTREEIHTAVAEMLEDYGIEAPDRWGGPAGFGHPWGGFWAELTEEQRQAVRDKMEEMRDQDATREEIRAAVSEMLEGYGVELPENWRLPGGHRGFGPGPGGFWGDLTEEQRQAIGDKRKEMRNQGASREDIHAAIAGMLEDYGIEAPEQLGGPSGLGHPWDGFWADLTEDQRQAVRDKRQEMRDQGASREEIHAAVAEMLEGYGVKLPEKGLGWHGPRGLGHWGECFGVDLTDEQRKAARERIREMRSENASRQEIHTAVAAMFETYGIELPDFPGKLTREQRKAMRKKIGEMKREGAGCEDIRAAVAKMLEQYGSDAPQQPESSFSETVPADSPILTHSYPNPFNPEADIAYMLNASEDVRIQIYNVAGQLIRAFDMGYQPAGSYSVRWNGRSENGDVAASGVYLYRIEAGPHKVTNRMVLLK